MANLFVINGLVKSYVIAIVTSILRSNGGVCHKSSMKDEIVSMFGNQF